MPLTINVPDEVGAQVYALPETERQFIDEAAATAVADALARRFAVATNSTTSPQLEAYNPLP